MTSSDHITTRTQIDHPGPLGFLADGRAWVPKWANFQGFLTTFRSAYRKIIQNGAVEKATVE